MMGLGSSGNVFSLPSYAQGHSGVFNPLVSLYNANQGNTRHLAAAVGHVLAGTGSGEIGFIGDSGMAGSTTIGGVYQATQSWPSYMRQNPSPVPIASQTDGWVRILAQQNFSDPRMAFTGVWSGTQNTYGSTAAANSTVVYTALANGVNCSVIYYDTANAAQFTITPQGGAVTTITCNGPLGWKVATTPAFAATNKVTVQNTVNNMIIAGVCIWNANTLMFHNMAQAGSTASQLGNQSWTDATTANSPYSAYLAGGNLGITRTGWDACFVGLGGNDLKNTVNAGITTTYNAMKTICQLPVFANTDLILCCTGQIIDSLLPASLWEQYISKMYDLADLLNVPFLDVRNIVGSYTQAANYNPYPYTVDGQGHMLPFANGIIGAAASTLLAA